jgi:hypothetical protein
MLPFSLYAAAGFEPPGSPRLFSVRPSSVMLWYALRPAYRQGVLLTVHTKQMNPGRRRVRRTSLAMAMQVSAIFVSH